MIRKEIKYVIIIAVGIAIIFLGIRFAFGVSNPFYVVASGSMIPILNIGDFVIVSHNVQFDSLKVGDIIVFRTFGTTDSGQHEIIVHRVAQIVTDNHGDKILRTKGDANDASIPTLDYPIFQQNYIGKVVYVIPQLGAISGAANNGTNNGGNTSTNWMDLCNKISFALVSSCNSLVNSDNTLTSQGIHVRDCIEGGACWLELLYFWECLQLQSFRFYLLLRSLADAVMLWTSVS